MNCFFVYCFIVLNGNSICSSHIVRFRMSVPLLEREKRRKLASSDSMEQEKKLEAAQWSGGSVNLVFSLCIVFIQVA